MRQPLSCCVVGDVNIDYISDLSWTSIDSAVSACYQSSVNSTVGGNAVFFAEAACDAGFDAVKMLCATGDDDNGTRVRDYLDQLGIEVRYVPSAMLTGQVIVLYQPNDRRILVADRGANRDIAAVDPVMAGEWAANSDLLYVSGYTLLDERERKAIELVAQGARRTGSLVLVDIVPHDIWKSYQWHEYVRICGSTQFIAAELSTIVGFLSDNACSLTLKEAAALVLRDFEGCVLRLNDTSDILIADRFRQRIVSVPYYRDQASLRFTDRVIAHVARQYLTDRDELFESSEWLCRLLSAVQGGL
jgi:sugar/nucleoside kinase (ribokinase family)